MLTYIDNTDRRKFQRTAYFYFSPYPRGSYREEKRYSVVERKGVPGRTIVEGNVG